MKINLLGDIAFNGLFLKDKQNNVHRFNEISHYFDDSTFTIANLEVPVKGKDGERNPNKNIHFYTEPDVVKEILPLLKIKVVSLANNHIGDYGVSGVQNTIDVLDELEILHTGAGTEKKHIDPVIFDFAGEKVAFLAYVDKSTNPKCENIPNIFINYLDARKVIKDIELIKSEVDLVILSIHWGIDYSYFYTKKQQYIAHNLIESGVDIIIGHHPHTFQPYEIYNDKPIFYSLGQLCFGDFLWEGELRALKRKTKTGMMVNLDLSNVLDFNIIPTRELKGNYICLPDINIKRKIARLVKLNKLRFESRLIDWSLRVKETFFDRIFEYFFGYYRNPIKQLLNLTNLTKLKYLIRDYKNS